MRLAFTICTLLMGALLSACQTTGTTSATISTGATTRAEIIGADTTKPTTETIEYISGDPEFYRDVLAGKLFDTLILTGKLHLPAGEGPFPVVVWQHGSGKPNTKGLARWRSELRTNLHAKGIGLFIADSYTQRKLQSTSRDQTRLSGTARVMDAYGALEALSNHPRVDGNRIGISGNSWGGIVSLNTTHEPWAEAIVSNGVRFAAHAPFFPLCGTKIDSYQPTGAPVLMLLGEADDWTRYEPCIAKAKRLEAAGVKVETVVYPGAHHNFISTHPVKFKPKVWQFNDCKQRIHTVDGEVVFPDANLHSKGMTFAQFLKGYIKHGCGKRGAHSGRNDHAAEDSMKRVVEFFVRSLKTRTS